jgi:MscS family membrane protein
MEFSLEPLRAAIEYLRESSQRGLTEGLVIIAVTLAATIFADRIMERVRSWVAKLPDPTLAIRILELLTRPVWLSVLILGMIAGGAHVLAYFHLSTPTSQIIGRILKSLVVIVWFVPATRILILLCDKWTESRPHAAEAIRFLKNLGIAALFVQAALLFLNVWHVDITPLLASAGIAGIAVGLAVKDMLANFFGGVTLFMDRPFKTGDYVVLSSGERGEVVEIGLRSTRVLTEDHILVIVPNSVLAMTKIMNESAPETQSRVRVTVGVAHGSAIDLVEQALIRVAKSIEYVADKPEPQVRFVTIGDASLQFELQCWVITPADRSFVVHLLNRAIYREFSSAGIGIPYTKKEIHGKKAAEKSSVIVVPERQT